MIQCHGEVVNEKSENYGKRCSLFCSPINYIDESTIEFYSQYCQYHQFQRNNKSIVVSRVKEYLQECEKAQGKDNKKKVVSNLFNYLLDNIGFMAEHKKFKDAVIVKFNEFIEIEKMTEYIFVKEKMLKLIEEYKNKVEKINPKILRK